MSTGTGGGGPADGTVSIGLDSSKYEIGAQELIRLTRKIEDEQLRAGRVIEDVERRTAQRQIQAAELAARGKIEATARVSQAIENDQRRMERVVTDSARRMDRAIDDAMARSGGGLGAVGGGRGGRGAQGLLQASYAIQDFQAAGFRGALNNIPLLVSALGAGAGLAGALQLVGVAFAALGPHLRQFYEQVRPDPVNIFGDSVESLRRKVDRLTYQKYFLQIDTTAIDAATAKFNAAQEAAKAFEATASKRTVEQVESGQRVTSAVANLAETATTTGGTNLERSVRDQLINSPKARAEIARLQKALVFAQEAQRSAPGAPGLADAVAAAEGRIKATRERQRTQAAEQAQLMIGGASAGQEQQLLKLIQTLQANPEFFRGREVEVGPLISALQGARPGAIAAQGQAEKQARDLAASDRVRESVDRALAAEEKRIAEEGPGEDPRHRFGINLRQAVMAEGAAAAFKDPVFARETALRLKGLESAGGGLPGEYKFQSGNAGPAGPGVIPVPVPVPAGENNIDEYMRQSEALFTALKSASGAPARPGNVPMQRLQGPPKGGVNR